MLVEYPLAFVLLLLWGLLEHAAPAHLDRQDTREGSVSREKRGETLEDGVLLIGVLRLYPVREERRPHGLLDLGEAVLELWDELMWGTGCRHVDHLGGVRDPRNKGLDNEPHHPRWYDTPQRGLSEESDLKERGTGLGYAPKGTAWAV